MNLPDIKAPESISKFFLKLKDRESIKGVFIGDMYSFYTKWEGGRSVPTDKTDPDGSVRFKCNFVTRGESGMEAKIWEFPYTVFEQLKGINAVYPLEKTKIQITRQGIGKDTTYQIIPIVGDSPEALTPTQLSAIKAVVLNPLERKPNAVYSPSSEQKSAWPEEDDGFGGF